jgi:uncharacterized protein
VTPERAASLFAEDGAFELPFLPSLGVEPRHTGRREIAGLIHQLLKLYLNFAFGPTSQVKRGMAMWKRKRNSSR